MIKGSHHTEEFKKRVSDKLKGIKFTEEHKRKISFMMKGQKNWLGKHHTEESKLKISQNKERARKISESHIGHKHSEEIKRKIGLGQINKIYTIESRRRIGFANSGERSGNWKGGITPINTTIRRSVKGLEWIRLVFEKDHFTCQKCKIVGGTLNAHHIKPFAEFPELRFEISNGITLHKKCHKLFHKLYGIRHNSKEQIDEFLKENI